MSNSTQRLFRTSSPSLWSPLVSILMVLAFATLSIAQTATKTDISIAEPATDNQDEPDLKQRSKDLLSTKSVVFLGDSITHGGSFIATVEATLLLNFDPVPKFINLGLPGETVSHLTGPTDELGRPNLFDRLESVLEKSKPDFVFACYGMDDGIYSPFDEKRFEAYKKGIRELIARVDEHGAKLVLITPPPFDTHQMQKKGMLLKADATGFSRKRVYENYDEEVIAKYAAWIAGLENDPSVYAVIDAYSVIQQFILTHRKLDPEYTFSADGIHFHAAGHWVLGHAILNEFLPRYSVLQDKTFEGLVRQRLAYNHMTWLTHVGHDNRALQPGPSFAELEVKMQPTNEKIEQFLEENRATK